MSYHSLARLGDSIIWNLPYDNATRQYKSYESFDRSLQVANDGIRWLKTTNLLGVR